MDQFNIDPEQIAALGAAAGAAAGVSANMFDAANRTADAESGAVPAPTGTLPPAGSTDTAMASTPGNGGSIAFLLGLVLGLPTVVCALTSMLTLLGVAPLDTAVGLVAGSIVGAVVIGALFLAPMRMLPKMLRPIMAGTRATALALLSGLGTAAYHGLGLLAAIAAALAAPLPAARDKWKQHRRKPTGDGRHSRR